MLKRVGQIFVLSSLSILLIFGSTAKEFVHLFAHHEDTIHNPHHICPEGEAHFEHEHHHCEFLHFVLEPFANDAFVPKIAFRECADYAQNTCLNLSIYIHGSVEYISLRGPPIF